MDGEKIRILIDGLCVKDQIVAKLYVEKMRALAVRDDIDELSKEVLDREVLSSLKYFQR